MRAALAVQVDQQKWRLGAGGSRRALAVELGEGWATDGADLGDAEVLDGYQGRGAANWIPVIEWLGVNAAEGVAGGAAWAAVVATYRQLRRKVDDAKARGHRVRVSRGLAVILAADHVVDQFGEKGPLWLEFVGEPSLLAGRPITETSYVGIEPWLVSLIDASSENRYLVVVNPEGEIQGCVATPMGSLEAMFSPIAPLDDASS